nr:hypothetical protein [Pandoravirus massiliensis]
MDDTTPPTDPAKDGPDAPDAGGSKETVHDVYAHDVHTDKEADTSKDDGVVGPPLAEILGDAVVEATRVAQRRATADQVTLTIGTYDPDRDEESAMHVDDADQCTRNPASDQTMASADTSLAPATHRTYRAWSTADVPAEVRARATRYVELDEITAGLRDRMRPLETALESLTLDLPPTAENATMTKRAQPSARAMDAAEKRQRHAAFAPARDAVAHYLSEVGAGKRGVPVRFPDSDALYRLRESVRTRAGTVTRADYRSLAVGAAAAAMAQIEVDPATPYSAGAVLDLLDDAEFRNRLFETVTGGVAQHREHGTVRTRAVSLVRVSGRATHGPTPP